MISVVCMKYVLEDDMIPAWMDEGAFATSIHGQDTMGSICNTIPECLKSMCSIIQNNNSKSACLVPIKNLETDSCDQWVLDSMPWHAHRMLIMTIPIFVLTLIAALIGYKGDRAGTWMFVLFNWANCVIFGIIGGMTIDIRSHPWSMVSNSVIIIVLAIDAIRISTLLFQSQKPKMYDEYIATDL
jgi:hypothetical protein